MQEPKRILILTADAGFGHRSCANAIAKALRERHGDDCVVSIVNPLDDERTPSLLRRSQTDYDRFVQAAPQLYDLGYQASDWEIPVTLGEAGLIVALHSSLRDALAAFRPDAIVSTHPYYQAPLSGVFAVVGHEIPVIAVVTDLVTVHGLWFHEDVDILAVPTTAVQQRAVDSNFPADRIKITGLPVDPAFAHPQEKSALRRQLGWEQEPLTILCTGSKRTKKIEPVSYALNHSVLPLQLIMVAGGDEALHRRWLATDWLLPSHVYGFVRNMPELMMASDMVVCKAGGLTVTESLAAGLPLLIVELIPGQETGNAEFVQREGAGEVVSDPLEALDTVLNWLDRDATILHARAEAARQAGRPDAAFRVADLAWEYAERGPQPHTGGLSGYAGQLRETLRRATGQLP